MFEDLITTLDDLGVEYTEDYDAGTLEVDIASIDKDTLVQIIMALNSAGDTFDITDSTITVTGGEVSTESEGEEEGTDYMSDALAQYGGETGGSTGGMGY